MLQNVPKDTAGYIFLEPFFLKTHFTTSAIRVKLCFEPIRLNGFVTDDCKSGRLSSPMPICRAIVSVLRVKLKSDLRRQ